jgi:hypothetical protein
VTGLYINQLNKSANCAIIIFDRKFVEHVPILKADGSRWDWERTTELGIIGSNTRTVRMYIDPKTHEGYKRTERLWRYVWEAQKW